MRTKFYSVNSAKSIFLVNEATFIKKIIWPHHLTRKKVLEFWEYDFPAFLLYCIKKAVIELYDVRNDMFICFLHNNLLTRTGYELRFLNSDNIIIREFVITISIFKSDHSDLYFRSNLLILLTGFIKMPYLESSENFSCISHFVFDPWHRTKCYKHTYWKVCA